MDNHKFIFCFSQTQQFFCLTEKKIITVFQFYNTTGCPLQ
jgi:hypothetical protein